MAGGWIAVACAEHVRRGRADGFMQICHGKEAPLRRILPGQVVAYYAPTEQFRGKDRLQAFVALGIVRQGTPYRFDMGGGFVPWRRDVDWLPAAEVPIRPLLPRLDFAASAGAGWGYRLRFGVLAISSADVAVIAAAMGARLPVLSG